MLSIIVVDDEISTLDGICHILRRHPDEFRIVAEATSAIKALEALEAENGNVDVVITDVRMPVMSGVQLVEILSQRYPMVQAIVLSAHSDYDYVRACLRHGAVDYLLKPCRYTMLLSTLRRVGGDKISREQLQVRESNQSRLKDILLSEDGLFPSDLPFRSAQLAYFQPGDAQPALRDKLQGCVAFAYALSEGDRSRYHVLEMDEGCLLLIDDTLLQDTPDKAMHALYYALEEECGGLSMAYAPVAEGDALSRALRRCRSLSDFAAFNALRRPVSIREKEVLFGRIVASGFSAYWTQAAIAKLRQAGDRAALEAAFDALRAGFVWPDGYLNPDEIKREAVRLLFSLEQSPDRQGYAQGDISDRYTEYTDRVRRAKRPDDLLDIVRDYILLLQAEAAGREKNQPRYIADAIRYIRAHYMENLQLPDISREVFLNEWYFSSQFKKHMGMSFKEFLNATRIEAAKRLLLENDLKVGQIAEMVGFSDATYFATTFKYNTGSTPKEFRKTRKLAEIKEV